MLDSYCTWIFDCDGVLLDSNSIKTEAFYEVALPFGTENAGHLVRYHTEHGGISRYEKFKYFFEVILGRSNYQEELSTVLDRYGAIVVERLKNVPQTAGMQEFITTLSGSCKKFIVSGGRQSEIRDVFTARGMDVYFDGIYGSPDTKEQIIHRLLSDGQVDSPAVFIGDSRYDYEVARRYDLDFIFMINYTEFRDWKHFFKGKPDVIMCENFNDIIPERRANNGGFREGTIL